MMSYGKQTTCPYCHAANCLVKAGRNPSGSQIFKCKACGRKSTPRPNLNGYADTLREQALGLYQRGFSFRAVGEKLNVSHQTVANWINAADEEEFA